MEGLFSFDFAIKEKKKQSTMLSSSLCFVLSSGTCYILYPIISCLEQCENLKSNEAIALVSAA